MAALPLGIICALLGLEEDFAAWSRWAYLLFFLYGLILASDERFRAAMRRDGALAGVLGVLIFMIGMPGFLIAGGDPFTDMTALAIGARALYGVAGWFLLVAILGLLDRRRPAPATADGPPAGRRRLSGYVAVAILPLYVLHQPVVVAVAYGVVRSGRRHYDQVRADRRGIPRPDCRRVRPIRPTHPSDATPPRNARLAAPALRCS
jgi:hypothetical protein